MNWFTCEYQEKFIGPAEQKRNCKKSYKTVTVELLIEKWIPLPIMKPYWDQWCNTLGLFIILAPYTCVGFITPLKWNLSPSILLQISYRWVYEVTLLFGFFSNSRFIQKYFYRLVFKKHYYSLECSVHQLLFPLMKVSTQIRCDQKKQCYKRWHPPIIWKSRICNARQQSLSCALKSELKNEYDDQNYASICLLALWTIIPEYSAMLLVCTD